MEDADEIFFLDDYNDAQELMVTQQEGPDSFSSGQCGTAAKKWNAQLFPNEALRVPGTIASHEDILKVPEREHSADIVNVPEKGSCDRILEAPNIESQGCVSTPSALSPPICRHNDSDVESDNSGSSLFRSQCTFTPTRTARRRSPATPSLKAPSIELHKDSSDSSSGPAPRFNLHQIFERRRRRRERRQGKYEAKKICRKLVKPTLQLPSEAIPLPRRQRRWKDETSTFPFLNKKDLPLKMIFTHEQGSLWGFLHQMKKLKCERHLQASLQNLNVSNESEGEHEDNRGYSYLDDDGPISPITELNEDQRCDDEDLPEKYDAKIVDNSCFILNWNPPAKKKQSKKKKKKLKTLGQDELDQQVAAMVGGDDEDL
ncbi:TATA box-binding protein-associated factor RNA polymerase I subunit D [Lissotriton helveticus]